MSQYAHPEVIVDTKWLADNLNNPNIRIVEVDMSPEVYQKAHIPGAVFWNLFTDLLQPNRQINFNSTQMEKILSNSGITPDTTIIAYGSYPGIGSFIFWLLNVFGHQNVRVLNGGYQKWKANGYPVAAEYSSFTPTEYKVQKIDNSLRAFKQDVQAFINQKDSILLDVRTAQEYRGECFFEKPPVATEKAGHIPSAVHIEHLLIYQADGTFKPMNELQAIYESRGITDNKNVIFYCAIGGRSASIWFVLKYLLGYQNIRNFDGSWNEWSKIPEIKIEK
ncbi:MAG: sulfurtransferase [Microcoleaceae cyanobacterium]